MFLHSINLTLRHTIVVAVEMQQTQIQSHIHPYTRVYVCLIYVLLVHVRVFVCLHSQYCGLVCVCVCSCVRAYMLVDMVPSGLEVESSERI